MAVYLQQQMRIYNINQNARYHNMPNQSKSQSQIMQERQLLHAMPSLYGNASPPPPSRASPRIHPQTHGYPGTNAHCPERARVALFAVTQDVTFAIAIRTPLINCGVYSTPNCCADSRCHGQNTPVCAEVLDTPDYGDDDWCQAEDGAVAGAD